MSTIVIPNAFREAWLNLISLYSRGPKAGREPTPYQKQCAIDLATKTVTVSKNIFAAIGSAVLNYITAPPSPIATMGMAVLSVAVITAYVALAVFAPPAAIFITATIMPLLAQIAEILVTKLITQSIMNKIKNIRFDRLDMLCAAGSKKSCGTSPESANTACNEALQTLKGRLPKDSEDKIFKAFQDLADKKFTGKEMVLKIQNGDLVLLPTGYKCFSGGHAAMLIFYNNQMMILNRGERDAYDQVIESYAINSKLVNEKILENLNNINSTVHFNQNYAKNKFFDYIYDALPLALQGEKTAETLTLKDQTVGNCPFAAGKAAFKAAFYLINKDKTNVIEETKSWKNTFSIAVRTHTLNKCKNSWINSFFYSKSIAECEAKLQDFKERKISLYKSAA
jgi:hypothetical protein